VVQRRGVLRLLPEARGEIGIAQVLRAEQLDGDVAAELRVHRPEDRRHAALADLLHEPVSATQDRPDLRQAYPSTWFGAPPTFATRSGRHGTPCPRDQTPVSGR
jgi:hypothetical protein